MNGIKETITTQDPSVIVGAACRVPGATNLHELWDLLDSKRDVQTKMPSDRYNADAFYHPEGANKSTSNAMLGYYLDQGLDQFDAAFFNISGKEAEAMDPQQRLLLEVVYEALENAGLTLKEIRGTKTSVFAGSFTYDYQSMTNRDLAHYPKYTVTGTDANAILANRISYVFDLHGPSVQVDTACSSSLTAFHLGVQSLQTGESDMAIICGTALHFDPTIFITMAEFGMLSTDGRCRHFDASGSGYVRGDGICAVVLKRQRAAELNGDRIRAVIRGTGTNHDGVKEGMTLPNNKAQASLVRDIYASAGLDPRDTGYFEAHGTGTQAGDPREALSIGEVFAAGRDDPLYVGSIKTNIGHLEGASGLAGIMKAMLSVERGKILPNMHFNTPNPKIDFDACKIRVPTETIEWNPENGIRRASINSFGFGGANSHVVLENYAGTQTSISEERRAYSVSRRPFILPLSSHSESGGKLLQKRVVEYIKQHPDTLVQDLVHTYSTRRSLHRFRSFAIGNDIGAISDAAATLSPLASWKQAGESPRLGFVFTGQGAQWYAMGRQLIEESPFFRSVLKECEDVLKTLPDAPSWSILDEMSKSEGESRLSQSEFSQPLCTALQIALVDTLKSWGVEPAAAIGHSSGEIAAAYSAGILSRRDTIICAYYRGLYMSKGRHGTAGSMMAVGLTEAEATIELAPFTGRAGIAAVNSPSSITLSGDKDAILEIKEKLDERKVFARLLQVEQAFHSHHMLPLAPGFQQALAATPGFSPRPASIPMFSSVTARDSSSRTMDGVYWSDNMTGRVRFSDAVTGMVLGEDDQLAVDVLVEIGPHPALKGPTKQTIKSLGIDVDIPYFGSLDRKVPAYESLLGCAGQLFSLGYPVDLVAANGENVFNSDGSITTKVQGNLLENAPTYSWDHKSFWSETRWNKEYRQRPYRHTILGAPVPGTPSNNPRWRNYIRLSELPWLRDHTIDGSVLFPAAAYFTLAIESFVRTVPVEAAVDIVLSDVQIKSALAVPDTEAGVEIMTDLLLDTTTDHRTSSYRFTVYSFTESGATVQNCSGEIAAVPTKSGQRMRSPAPTFEQRQLEMQAHTPTEKFYSRLGSLGLQYGDSFKLVSGAFESGAGASAALLEFDPSKIRTGDAKLDSCVLHPTFLDASFHTILSALESKSGRSLTDAHVATSCGTLRVLSPMIARCKEENAQKYWVSTGTDIVNQRLSTSSIHVCDVGSTEPLVELHDVQFTALGLADAQSQAADAFFRTAWKPAFSFLGSNETEPEFAGIDDLIACYAHQYPGNTILRLQDNSDAAELSGHYDLLVLENESPPDITAHKTAESLVVSTGSQQPAQDLELQSKHGDLSIWRAARTATSPSPLTILLSSSPSQKSLGLVQSIESNLNGINVSVTTLNELDEDTASGNNVLSLVELDQPTFSLDSRESESLAKLIKFLSSASANLVWLQIRDALGQSFVSQISRVARTENPDLQMTVLRVPSTYSVKHAIDSIHYALTTSGDGEELEIRDGCLLLPRIKADRTLTSRYAQNAVLESFSNQCVRVSPGLFSSDFQSPAFEVNNSFNGSRIADDEVEVEVQTSMLLSRPDAITSCVGTITLAGPISGLQIGQQVLLLEKNQVAHASRLRVKAQLAFALDVKSIARALPITSHLLQTAYAIHEVARVQKGDFCLINDAFTPAGQMAISLLQSLGSRFVAVVRKESQRARLLEQFKLPGDAVVVDYESVREAVGYAPHRNAWRLVLQCSEDDQLIQGSDQSPICSHMVSVGSQSSEHGPALSYKMLSGNPSKVRDLFNHSLKTLDMSGHTFTSAGDLLRVPYARATEAMQALRADSELHQVLLYADDSPVELQCCSDSSSELFNADKTYLLSGSFGDAGWVLAQWLFRKGARKLSALVHPLCAPLPPQAIAWLQQRGVDIKLHVVNEYQNGDVVEWLESVHGKIGGVIQGAMPVSPLLLSELEAKTLHETVQPFCSALQTVHTQTISHALDFFLCISSIAPVVGVSSEVLYCVTNGYLDDFVAWRRQHGFPAASLSIGLVDNIGLLSETQSIRDSLTNVGIDRVSEDQFFFQLEQGVLAQYPDGEADGTCDHHILSGVSFSSREDFWSSKPTFRGLFESAASSTGSTGTAKDLRSLMREARTAEEKQRVLAEAFVEKIAISLSISNSDINIGLPLASYGMDSLAAVDFRKWFSQELGVSLALFEILGSGTIRVIIERVCEVFATQEEEKPKATQTVKQNVKAKDLSAELTSGLVLPSSRPKSIPLSSFQTRQWFMDTVMEQDGALTCGWTLSIQGEPNLEAVNTAFHEVARRNEIFRTRYFEGDDMVEQEVIAAVPAKVEYVDISGVPGADAKAVQDLVYDLIGQPMDLEKGEVYRSRLVKLGHERYAWIFATHHITVDGASRQLFMEQIVSCYDDARSGSNSESSAPKLSYIDFTLWHEGYLKSEQVQVDLAWWKSRLTDAPQVSKLLPFAQREIRGEKASHERRVIRSRIDMNTLKRMKRICSSVNVTPFHFILASLRALIFRYTAEEDFTLLVINGERPHPAFEGIIGFFVNIIPLLWKGSFDDTFESLLAQAKSLTMESMAHSQAPFDAIVDALDLGHNPSHFPLGQIALNYQMYAKSPNYTSADFEIQDVHVTDVPTACELQFEVLEDPKTGLGFTLDYDSYLYGATEMDRFLENFMTFIGSAVRDFRQPVEELEMCGSKETQFLREVCWFEEESSADWMGKPLLNRWSEIVRQQPLATAIKTSDAKSITFSDLNDRATQIAHLLQASGAKSGDRVGVLSDPSIDVMASMLGVALLRCVYVPLDPSAAQGRLEYMIDNTSAPLVLHGSGLDSLVENLRGSTRTKFIAMTDATPNHSGAIVNETPQTADDVCYIVFTSGSTGKPKGVMVTFENTEAMLCGRQQIHGLGSNDTFLQQSSTSFDISMAQTWGSLTSGATMALATKEARQDVDDLASFIRDAGATMVYMTPTQLAMVLENCSDILKQCHKLRAVSLIGEHLPPRLVSAVYDLGLPSLTVFNEYGPSESTSQNTLYKVPYPSTGQASVDIGRPIPNSSTYVLNSRGRPVPVGVSGELCVGGPQVSLGYLGRSSDAFLDNQFASGVFKQKGWNRLYRTGDMARFRLNGNIDLQGRISGDKQVKLRGHRIDLEEIEAEIRRIAAEDSSVSAVTGAILLARTLSQSAPADMTDDRQLVAFLTTKSKLGKTESQAIASKLHVQLGKTLNKYMIPACYQPMAAFPMTVSGKIDRVTLNNMTLDPVFHIEAAIPQGPQQDEVSVTHSSGPLETIKSLFSSILKLPSQKVVQDTDNFFELGGQSVLALRLQKGLKKELAVKVKLVDIFRNPTPAGLAKRFGFESTLDSSVSVPPQTKVELNWDSETALPNDSRYFTSSAVEAEKHQTNGHAQRRILILGADGYIGYYMLKFLLAIHRDAKVYLLGLGDRFNLGDLFSAFTEHQMFDDSVSQMDLLTRAEIVQGTMGQKKFGLTDDEFVKLGRSVDAIYHTGGFVSLLATYEELRPRNVQSVFDMIELASHGSGPVPTALHYISTWSIVHVQTWSSTSLLSERVWLDEQSVALFRPPATNDHGYFKTRWVSEMLMEEAGKRGFPTTIYRCPAHTAPTAAKCATPGDNFTINMCVRMAETGLVLETPKRHDSLESDMGMIPIDYLADTLVRLADVEEVVTPAGETLRLHITNPNSLPYSKVPELVGRLHNGAVKGRMLDLDEWFEAITAVSNEKINLELSMYKEYLDKGHIMFTIDDAKTRPLLDKIASQAGRLQCDAVDLAYLQNLLRQEQGRQ